MTAKLAEGLRQFASSTPSTWINTLRTRNAYTTAFCDTPTATASAIRCRDSNPWCTGKIACPHFHLGLRNYLFTHSATGYEAKMCGLTSASAAPAGGRRLQAMVGPLVSYMFH